MNRSIGTTEVSFEGITLCTVQPNPVSLDLDEGVMEQEKRKEMVACAREIGKEPSHALSGFIKDYQNRIDEQLAALQRGEEVDIELLARDAHVLMMLLLRKSGRTQHELENFAHKEIIVLRDKIRETHNSWAHLSVAILGGGLMIAGGLGHALPLVNVTEKIKDAVVGLGSAGQGVQGLGSLIQSRDDGERTYLNVTQQVMQGKEGQMREQKQQEMNRLQRCADQALRINDNKHQARIAMLRSSS